VTFLQRCCEGSGNPVPLPSKNVSVLRAALVFALLISACRSSPPTEGWSEVARASGVVPNQSGVTECRWDLPCQRVESGEFSTTGRPLRLVCTGRVDLLFVEYFHGPEPHSGNGGCVLPRGRPRSCSFPRGPGPASIWPPRESHHGTLAKTPCRGRCRFRSGRGSGASPTATGIAAGCRAVCWPSAETGRRGSRSPRRRLLADSGPGRAGSVRTAPTVLDQPPGSDARLGPES